MIAAERLRGELIAKYPDSMAKENIGQMPNDAVFHAEATALLRAARANGGSLAGKELMVHVDRPMCSNCSKILPLIGLELGDPMRAYDEACMAYEHARASELHREFYAIEDALRRRRRDDNWRRTGLESLSVEEVVEKFKERAMAYEEADGSDETEHLYDELNDAKDELKRRPGDQRRSLFSLYTHPDVRIRYAAADATRTLAPRLSKHRLLNIDDSAWQPPSDGLDIEGADLTAVFPTRAKRPDRLKALSVEQLVERFADLALQQYQAELHGEIAKQNRFIQQGWGVEEELKNRPGDQRRALVRLFEHPNAQVRLNAATATLATIPTEARMALENLAASNVYPQSGEAGGRLRNLDSGFFKPT